MTATPGFVPASGSVAIIAAVSTLAIALGPAGPRTMLILCALVACVLAVQSVTWDAAALTPALLTSILPVIALLSEGSAAWLIGPLGALLLVAGELNALSWELRGKVPIAVVARRRYLNITQLGAFGLVGSLAVGFVAAVPASGGTAAVLLGAAALAALGFAIFGRMR